MRSVMAVEACMVRPPRTENIQILGVDLRLHARQGDFCTPIKPLLRMSGIAHLPAIG